MERENPKVTKEITSTLNNIHNFENDLKKDSSYIEHKGMFLPVKPLMMKKNNIFNNSIIYI